MEYRKHLQDFIDRWRYNANRGMPTIFAHWFLAVTIPTAPQAQSRIKMLEKVRSNPSDRAPRVTSYTSIASRPTASGGGWDGKFQVSSAPTFVAVFDVDSRVIQIPRDREDLTTATSDVGRYVWIYGRANHPSQGKLRCWPWVKDCNCWCERFWKIDPVSHSRLSVNGHNIVEPISNSIKILTGDLNPLGGVVNRNGRLRVYATFSVHVHRFSSDVFY
jgi:hypothetical protein